MPRLPRIRVENITFEDIDIFGSLNGGIRVSDMPGDVTIRNVNIIRKPGTPNLLSTPSDALHLMNIRGRLLMENCVIESPGDDCLNVGTMLERLVGLSETDNKTMTLRTLDNYYYYYTIRSGDRLQFFNTSTKRILGEATVAEAAIDRRRRTHRVTLDREIPGVDVETSRVMNLDQMTRRALIRNNIMRPYMRNAMLSRAEHDHSEQHPGLFPRRSHRPELELCIRRRRRTTPECPYHGQHILLSRQYRHCLIKSLSGRGRRVERTGH